MERTSGSAEQPWKVTLAAAAAQLSGQLPACGCAGYECAVYQRLCETAAVHLIHGAAWALISTVVGGVLQRMSMHLGHGEVIEGCSGQTE